MRAVATLCLLNDANRIACLREALSRRILVLDGATGTALADRGLWAADYGGEELLGCHEALLLHRPDVILDLHRGYLAAGADILKTDSFGATPVVLAEYGLADHTVQINTMAAALARRRRRVAAEAADGRPRFVAGSIGPTTRSLTLTGGITFSELVAAYRRRSEGLAQGGADVLLVETVQDALNLKAALIACREGAPGLPVAVSATMEPSGTTLGGQSIEAIAVIVEPWAPLWLGINCSTGPGPDDRARAGARRDRAVLRGRLPQRRPARPARAATTRPPRSSRAPWRASPPRAGSTSWAAAAAPPARTSGRCEGSRTPTRPAPAAGYDPPRLAGGEAVEIVQTPAPLLVGERTNALGSRKFRELARAGRFAEGAEIGRRQVRGGAHVLDVCLADPEADESTLMEGALLALRRSVRVPLMIDSTDPAVIARALELIPGRPVAQLGEPRGRRGAPRGGRRPGAALRRGRRRRLHRRAPHRGHGPHRRAQARGGGAPARPAGGVRPAPAGRAPRRAGLPRRQRRPPLRRARRPRRSRAYASSRSGCRGP